MSTNTVEIMNKGMACLTDAMGVVEAEKFISIILRERFDYTKWQREHFDTMKPGTFHDAAVEYAKKHPYEGDAERL